MKQQTGIIRGARHDQRIVVEVDIAGVYMSAQKAGLVEVAGQRVWTTVGQHGPIATDPDILVHALEQRAHEGYVHAILDAWAFVLRLRAEAKVNGQGQAG